MFGEGALKVYNSPVKINGESARCSVIIACQTRQPAHENRFVEGIARFPAKNWPIRLRLVVNSTR
jgi:hypothetical protein